MRRAHCVAAHFAQHCEPEPLQGIRDRRTNSRVVLVIAGSLNLHGLSIQKKSLVRRELRGSHSKAHALRIASLASRFNGHDCLV